MQVATESLRSARRPPAAGRYAGRVPPFGIIISVTTAAGKTDGHAHGPAAGQADEEKERLTALGGLAALSLDALSSVAYGPEAILIVLVAAGASALKYSLPITGAIVVLLAALVISYRQVIEAFPNGGGAYAVSKTHLGTTSSLVAAASLTVDYILNAAVGVSAGVEALTAAYPSLYGARVWLCLAVLAADHRGEPVGRGRVRPALHGADARVHRLDLRRDHHRPAPRPPRRPALAQPACGHRHGRRRC